MTPNDRRAFLEVVIGFAELKGKQLSAPALELYWRALRHWPLDEFRAAAEHLLRTCEFMPVPRDFEQLRKAGELTPAEAWTEVLAGCLEWRRSERLPTGRVARAAAAVGGFRAITMADVERDVPHIERRFKAAYAELEDVEQVREALPQLTGGDRLPELQNLTRGLLK